MRDSDYLWDATSGVCPPSSVSVIEPTKQQREERERRDAAKLEQGARMVAFGFARALPAEVEQPLVWEGDAA